MKRFKTEITLREASKFAAGSSFWDSAPKNPFAKPKQQPKTPFWKKGSGGGPAPAQPELPACPRDEGQAGGEAEVMREGIKSRTGRRLCASGVSVDQARVRNLPAVLGPLRRSYGCPAQ